MTYTFMRIACLMLQYLNSKHLKIDSNGLYNLPFLKINTIKADLKTKVYSLIAYKNTF